MTLRVVGTAVTMLGALGAAGCNMSMPGVGGGDRPEAAVLSPRPAPLRAAPSSPVRRDELPPPAATEQLAAQTPADGAVAPAEGDGGPLGAVAAAEAALASPSGDTAPAGPAAVQVAAVDEASLPETASPAASSVPAAQAASAAPARPAVGRGNFVGGWNVSAGGDNCKLFPSLSSWSGGMRASTRGCSSPALKNVSAWQQSGNQVTLMDSSGQPVARLFPSGDKQYNGQTEDGASISVSR